MAFDLDLLNRLGIGAGSIGVLGGLSGVLGGHDMSVRVFDAAMVLANFALIEKNARQLQRRRLQPIERTNRVLREPLMTADRCTRCGVARGHSVVLELARGEHWQRIGPPVTIDTPPGSITGEDGNFFIFGWIDHLLGPAVWRINTDAAETGQYRIHVSTAALLHSTQRSDLRISDLAVPLVLASPLLPGMQMRIVKRCPQ